MSESNKMQLRERKPKVVFVVNGQRVSAQKEILCNKNDVFRAMLSENFRESKDKEVVIKDTTFEAFKTVIEFIHTEHLVINNGKDFQLIDEIYRLSDQYDVKGLFEALVAHMKTIRVTLKNIVLFSRFAYNSEDIEMITEVIKCIAKNMNKLIDSNKWTEIQLFTQKEILRLIFRYESDKKIRDQKFARINAKLRTMRSVWTRIGF